MASARAARLMPVALLPKRDAVQSSWPASPPAIIGRFNVDPLASVGPTVLVDLDEHSAPTSAPAIASTVLVELDTPAAQPPGTLPTTPHEHSDSASGPLRVITIIDGPSIEIIDGMSSIRRVLRVPVASFSCLFSL